MRSRINRRQFIVSSGGLMGAAMLPLPVMASIGKKTPGNSIIKFAVASDKGFVPYPHLKRLDDTLVKAVTEGGKKIMILMPPQTGKTTLMRFLLEWTAQFYPNKKMLYGTYLSGHTDWIRKEVYEITENPNKGRFPRTNIRTIPITHLKPLFDIGIIDGAVKNVEGILSVKRRQWTWEWYQMLLEYRTSNGSTILIMSRWHQDDLAGRILKHEGKEWDVIRMPAINENGKALCEKMYPLKHLKESRKSIKSMDEFYWQALYQQTPIA